MGCIGRKLSQQSYDVKLASSSCQATIEVDDQCSSPIQLHIAMKKMGQGEGVDYCIDQSSQAKGPITEGSGA